MKKKTELILTMREEIEYLLSDIYHRIGIDKPDNHYKIIDFIEGDIKETADPNKWHSGDVDIAFRRFIESK